MLVRFRLDTDTEPGAPVVSGEPQPLGAWEPTGALRMQRAPDGVWEAEAELPPRFTYRFVLLEGSSGAVGERGVTREADLERMAPGADDVRQLDNHWKATLVRFVAHHPLPAGQRLAVVGGHAQLGDWESPRPMDLGDERTLDTGGRGTCWETVVPFREPVEDLAYRYVVLASEPRWEREPDRHLAVPAVEKIPNGLFETSDRNIVTGLDVNWVDPDVCVGPYPQTPGHADALAEVGVTAVVNLQTDRDLRHRGVDLDRLHRTLRQHGIELHRLPIQDFDEADLIRNLPTAAALLHRLTEAGHRTYVHCTAGMGRAPAVVLSYLVRQGHDLPEAQAHLRDCHPVSAPNLAAVESAMEAGVNEPE